MKKSFKRVIASFLAVLMVMFAMPFSALAYGTDETPNFGLIFNAFTFNNKYFNYTQNATAVGNRGIKDMPLQWTNNQLWARKSIADAAGFTADSGATTANRRYTESGDRQLVNGDYFTMSVTVENIATVFSWGANIQYTGVEPATIYKYSYDDPESGDTVTSLTLIAKEDNTTLQNKAEELGLDYDEEVVYEEFAPEGLPISQISSGSTYFKNQRNFDIGGSTYESWGIAAGGASDDDYTELTSCPTQGSGVNTYKNPETGAPSYDFSYRVPMVTYLFKVTDKDNINFDIYGDEAYFTTDFDHISKDDTWNYNKYDVDGVTELAKGATVNFLGTNRFNEGPAVETGSVAITTPAGYEDISLEGNAGDTYTVPDLADYTKAADAAGHYTAQWKDNNVPSGTFSNTAETFEIEFASAEHTYGEATIDPQPTCVTPGTATYTCSVCNYSYTEEVTDANAHSWGAWAIDEDSWAVTTDQTVEANNSATVNVKRVCANSASHTETDAASVAVTAFTAAQEGVAGSVTFTATYDGATVGTKTVTLDPLAHTHNYATRQEIPETRVASTCKTAGSYQTALYCACGEYDATSVQTETLELDATNHENLQNVAAKDATCEEAGNVAYSYCDACGKYYVNGAEVQAADVVIAATDHDFSGAIDIAWTENAATGEGKWTATAVQHCVNDASHTTAREVTINYSHKDATNKEAGYDKWEAVVNGDVQDTKTETIAAAGINITVAKTDLGSVEFDGEDTNGAEVTKSYKYGAKYTVRAVRPAGTTFLGWKINNKIVSQAESYSSIAYVDTEIVPVFQETADDTINVYFYDKYGNEVKSFVGVTAAEYQAAVAEEVPAAPNYPGYKFTGYDKADDVIKANAASATYWAQYEKDAEAATYTVNAPGATITAEAGDVDGETATNVPYDTKVTVKAEGAAAWSIDGTVVAYGDTYTFFVGSDVTVTPVADAEVQPAVAIISTSNSGNSYTLLATRTAGNATITERGWIFGTVNDAALENLDTAKAAGARQTRANVTASEQFSLTFNIKNAGTTVKARAFIVDAQGNVYYSNIATVTK